MTQDSDDANNVMVKPFVINVDVQALMLRLCEAFVDNKVLPGVTTEQALNDFEEAMPKIAEGMARVTAAACEYMTECISEGLESAGYAVDEGNLSGDDDKQVKPVVN